MRFAVASLVTIGLLALAPSAGAITLPAGGEPVHRRNQPVRGRRNRVRRSQRSGRRDRERNLEQPVGLPAPAGRRLRPGDGLAVRSGRRTELCRHRRLQRRRSPRRRDRELRHEQRDDSAPPGGRRVRPGGGGPDCRTRRPRSPLPTSTAMPGPTWPLRSGTARPSRLCTATQPVALRELRRIRSAQTRAIWPLPTSTPISGPTSRLRTSGTTPSRFSCGRRRGVRRRARHRRRRLARERRRCRLQRGWADRPGGQQLRLGNRLDPAP